MGGSSPSPRLVSSRLENDVFPFMHPYPKYIRYSTIEECQGQRKGRPTHNTVIDGFWFFC